MLFPTPLVRHPHSAATVDTLHTDNIHMRKHKQRSHGEDWVVKSCMRFFIHFRFKACVYRTWIVWYFRRQLFRIVLQTNWRQLANWDTVSWDRAACVKGYTMEKSDVGGVNLQHCVCSKCIIQPTLTLLCQYILVILLLLFGICKVCFYFKNRKHLRNLCSYSGLWTIRLYTAL